MRARCGKSGRPSVQRCLQKVDAFFHRPVLCLLAACAAALLCVPGILLHFSRPAILQSSAAVFSSSAGHAAQAGERTQTPAPSVSPEASPAPETRFCVFVEDRPIYTLKDAAKCGQDLVSLYGQDASLLSVSEGEVAGLPMLRLDFTAQEQAMIAWAAPGSEGFGCRLLFLSQGEQPTAEQFALIEETDAQGRRYSLLEEETLQLRCLYPSDILSAEPIQRPQDKQIAASCRFPVGNASFCLIENASAYADSERKALDICMADLKEVYPNGEVRELELQYAEKTFEARRYSHSAQGGERLCTIACTELDGRLITIVSYSLAKGRECADAQRLFEALLRSVSALRS